MFARHSLVWLTDAGWRDAQARTGAAAQAAIEQWRRSGWPAVARRSDADARDDELCAGIAQPPDAAGVKQRLPLRIGAAHVHSVREPLPLAAALAAAPAPWRDELAALDAAARAEGIVLRVYGSLALQCLTGLSYLTPDSDIDLLLQPATRAQLAAGLRLLTQWATRLPLDGEIVFPGGAAVAWKEWAHAADARARVLAKGSRAVHLATTGTLLALLRDGDA